MKKKLMVNLVIFFFSAYTLIVTPGSEAQSDSFPKLLQPEKLINDIQQLIGDMEGIHLRVIGDRAAIEGQPLSYFELQRLKKIIQAYPQLINLLDERVEKPMIGIELTILEHDPEGAQPNLVANPKFIISEGDTAVCCFGGEFAYPHSSDEGKAIEWKKHGFAVKISPQLLPTDHVFLSCDIKASVLVRDERYDSEFPALQIRRLKNTLTVRRGESTIIGGVLLVDEIRKTKRFPVLGHILPFLFSSSKKIKRKKELMLLVTPHVPPDFKSSDFQLIRAPSK
ncbi:hypothetical protein JXJ21_17535 [candidate division KSB1 bacterium]|nr:hypothetical protein [candidate division KSB1 bacterium]